jgi:hypothetical protein
MDDNTPKLPPTDPKPVLIQTDYSGLEMRIMAEIAKEIPDVSMGATVPSDPPCLECKSLASMTPEEVASRLNSMTMEEKIALAKSMVQPKRGPKDYGKKGHRRPRGPAPVKQPPKPQPNEKCPCGSGKKFKKCCGSNAGDLHYFVACGETALEDDVGRIMVFTNPDTAVAAAKAKRWAEGDVIPLPPERFAKFKEQLPYVMVVAKEFDVAPKEGEVEEKTSMMPITDMARILTTVAKDNRDAAKETEDAKVEQG